MLLSNLDILATAPGGVARLRELILTLAVQGKLVPQDPADEPASVLPQKIRAEKDRLIAEGKIKRDKPLAEIAEEEKPFGLPQGWEWVRLGTVATISTGKLDANAAVTDGQFPFFTCSQTPLKIDKYSFDCPAVLLAGNGDFNLKHYTGKFDAYQRTYVIEPVLLDLRFLYFTMSKYIGELTKNQRGSAIPYLKLGDITDPLIPLPPLPEQSRIVTRVEELMRLCDALEVKGQLQAAQHAQLVSTLLGTLTASTTPEELADHWQRVAQHFDLLLDRPAAIDALEQTLLQLAVRGLLVPQDPQDEPASALLQKIRTEKDRLIATGQIKQGKPLPPITDEEKPFELPVGWEWARLGEVADNRLGKMLDKAKNTGKRYPYLRNTNVQWRHIELDDIKEISLEAGELEEFRLLPGDLLICEGGYPGRCAIWNEPDLEMYFQKALHRVRPRGGVAVELIAISLESDSKSGNLEQHFTGATIKHFVGQALDRYVIPLPPLPEQSRIVARVTTLRRLCADLRQRLAERQSVQARLAEALVANNAQTSTQQEDECHAA